MSLLPELDRKVVLQRRVDLHGEAQVCQPGRWRMKGQCYPPGFTGVSMKYRCSARGQRPGRGIRALGHDGAPFTAEGMHGFGRCVPKIYEIVPVTGPGSFGVLRWRGQSGGG